MKDFLIKFTALTLSAFILLLFTPAYAAGALTSLSDTMTRLKAATASDHTFKLSTPTALTDTTDKIEITFPAGFTVGSVDFSDIDLSHGASTGYETEEGLAALADATNWGAAFSGQILTLDHPTNALNGDIAANDKIVVEIGLAASGGNAQISNPSAGTYVIDIKTKDGAAETDTGKVAAAIIADDQFTVSTSVDPSITFTLNDTVVMLPALSIGSVSTDTTSFTVNTNAISGYVVTVTEDGNLRFGANDINDVADGTVTAGSEEYGVSTSKSSQTIAQTSGNNATAMDATNKQCASATGPVSSDSTTLTLHASMAGSTTAGAYSHTVTVIATANF